MSLEEPDGFNRMDIGFTTPFTTETSLEQFDKRIVSLNGPISWPLRSPDFSPLDFYATIEILRQRTLDTIRNINGNTLAR
ncbi:unnamed protein product [Ceutorhynchus assimilis]|uniref:Uncharacterized protein n=1 Tax=Ceutorhynchus assimilis TaxID=467358 RepID=A0A9N9MCZ9_9CUCU|nr:unnamed protein product [Ceutorhynchus assimilis]